MGKAIVKLVKKVKKLEKVVKIRKIVLSESEEEDAENSSKQGRNLQKDESAVFETPTQAKSSGEADVSSQGLEAAETLAKVLSQRAKVFTKEVNSGLRRNLDTGDVKSGEEINTGFEEVSTGFTKVSTGKEKVSTGKEKVSSGSEEVSVA